MKLPQRCAVLLGVLLVPALVADAANPQLGGPMKHLFVYVDGNVVSVEIEGDPAERLALRNYGEVYEPPADVLDGRAYNGQYGWLPGGFIFLPPGAGLWVALVDQTDGLLTYEALTFAPLFTTGGSSALWNWSGAMVHNWYATAAPGSYDATYTVYVGDSVGAPLPDFVPGSVTLLWEYVPPVCAGDANCDGVISWRDIDYFIAGLNDNQIAWTALFPSGEPACLFANLDCNLDAHVTWRDIDPFIALLNTTCP